MKPRDLVFGVYRPSKEMGKLANLLKDGLPCRRTEVLQTIATKHPEERLLTLAREGKNPSRQTQTHLWELDPAKDLICMQNIREKPPTQS